ncbi:hypothetical protein GGS26DRAFT_455229 [Hypomontagnella submonticulosa]|nr:hypothetical protein GGS26DRAFT_455229 [Hypomontagnella submonticulosa]
MLAPLPWSTVDLFYHVTLAIYLVLFLYLHANHIWSLALVMADTMNPQTPPRKLFKPSSKTKTPTPSKKQTPATPTHSSTQSHDVLTPTETVSRSTDAIGGPLDSAKNSGDNITRDTTSDQTHSPPKSIAGKPLEVLSPSSDTLPEPSNPTDALNSPTDIAKYFAEQGSSEMSTFVSALTGETPRDRGSVIIDNIEASEGTADNSASPAPGEASESIKELPRDDVLIATPNQRTQEALSKTAQSATTKTSDTANETPDLSEPADVSKVAEGAVGGSDRQFSDTPPTNIVGEPDTSNIAKEAHVAIPNGKDNSARSVSRATNGVRPESTDTAPGATSDGTRVTDNMGQPAHIERRIEIPLPRPEKVVSSPPQPEKPDMKNITTGLGDFEDLPGTEGLRGTDELPELPEDPPEEILDPSVHSPSSNITPIPKIPKITPIGTTPPPDLLRLAHGLGGNVVDDVGNIVDESGKVLGHAIGDLPAMVGRKVADNGEVYGEDGEIIGYVSENFTDQPTPTDIPENVLGGLKVDHQGNILDTNGNIIGRFNEKAGENGSLAPFMNRSRANQSQANDSKPRDEEKPKVNAHTGGSPSDIFLDVKSTTDGIQLTIRIPTTFGRQPQDS